MNKKNESTFFVEIEYDDKSSFSFNVTISGKEHEVMAHLRQITRGTLMASNGYRAICYRDDGFDICSYINAH